MPLNNDDIKQLINILQRGLINDEPEITNQDAVGTSDTKPTRQKKKMAKKTTDSYNKFETMPEKNMNKHSPTQRSREFNTIDVACRVCGRKETINSALAYDSGNRYKCNKCSRVPG
jgi:predicted RNA-binding Zn-ribbon protein involved in translation (DUF1610 family)